MMAGLMGMWIIWYYFYRVRCIGERLYFRLDLGFSGEFSDRKESGVCQEEGGKVEKERGNESEQRYKKEEIKIN